MGNYFLMFSCIIHCNWFSELNEIFFRNFVFRNSRYSAPYMILQEFLFLEIRDIQWHLWFYVDIFKIFDFQNSWYSVTLMILCGLFLEIRDIQWYLWFCKIFVFRKSRCLVEFIVIWEDFESMCQPPSDPLESFIICVVDV